MNEVGLGVNTPRKKAEGDPVMSVHHVPAADAEKRFAELLDLADQGEEVVIDRGHGKKYIIKLESQEERRDRETLQGMADCQAGRLIDGEQVLEWVESWGTKNEKEPPRL